MSTLAPPAPARASGPGRLPASVYVAALVLALFYFQTIAVSLTLTAIRDDLSAGVAGLQWAVNGFSLVLASLLVPAGALTDRWGAKRACEVGLWLFIAGLAVAAAAPSVPVLIGGQALAGLGAALIVPSSTTIGVETSAPGPQRAKAIGLLGMGGAVGFALGPVLAGTVVALLGWRGAFVMPLLCALALLVAVRLLVPASARRPGRRVDSRATLAAVAAVAALVFVLIDGNASGWLRPVIAGALVVAILAGAAFAVVELRTDHRLMPPGIIRERETAVVMLFGAAHNAAIYGLLFVVVLALPAMTGITPLELGMMLLPQAVGAAISAPIAARSVAKRGPRRALTAGSIVAGTGMASLGFAHGDHAVAIAVFGLWLCGSGGGALVPAMTSAVTIAVPKELTATGAAMLNASRQLGGVFGVALIGGAAVISDERTALQVAAAGSVSVQIIGLLMVRRWVGTPRGATSKPSQDHATAEPESR